MKGLSQDIDNNQRKVVWIYYKMSEVVFYRGIIDSMATVSLV